VAGATEDQFAQLAAMIVNEDNKMSGKLVVTTVPEFAAALIPILADYQIHHPNTTIELVADQRLLKLEYGEAHVSIRAGPEPTEPDNVVQHLIQAAATLYAARSYIERHGPMARLADINGHRFVALTGPPTDSPIIRWMRHAVPEAAIAFRATDAASTTRAIENGLGIGPMVCWAAAGNAAVVPVTAPPPDWIGDLWLVTHVDLHRTAKVQSFLAHIKAAVAPPRDDITGVAARRAVL
jgi:DNA-binding transcriptional LysR family regulator